MVASRRLGSVGLGFRRAQDDGLQAEERRAASGDGAYNGGGGAAGDGAG